MRWARKRQWEWKKKRDGDKHSVGSKQEEEEANYLCGEFDCGGSDAPGPPVLSPITPLCHPSVSTRIFICCSEGKDSRHVGNSNLQPKRAASLRRRRELRESGNHRGNWYATHELKGNGGVGNTQHTISKVEWGGKTLQALKGKAGPICWFGCVCANPAIPLCVIHFWADIQACDTAPPSARNFTKLTVKPSYKPAALKQHNIYHVRSWCIFLTKCTN